MNALAGQVLVLIDMFMELRCFLLLDRIIMQRRGRDHLRSHDDMSLKQNLVHFSLMIKDFLLGGRKMQEPAIQAGVCGFDAVTVSLVRRVTEAEDGSKNTDSFDAVRRRRIDNFVFCKSPLAELCKSSSVREALHMKVQLVPRFENYWKIESESY